MNDILTALFAPAAPQPASPLAASGSEDPVTADLFARLLAAQPAQSEALGPTLAPAPSPLRSAALVLAPETATIATGSPALQAHQSDKMTAAAPASPLADIGPSIPSEEASVAAALPSKETIVDALPAAGAPLEASGQSSEEPAAERVIAEREPSPTGFAVPQLIATSPAAPSPAQAPPALESAAEAAPSEVGQAERAQARAAPIPSGKETFVATATAAPAQRLEPPSAAPLLPSLTVRVAGQAKLDAPEKPTQPAAPGAAEAPAVQTLATTAQRNTQPAQPAPDTNQRPRGRNLDATPQAEAAQSSAPAITSASWAAAQEAAQASLAELTPAPLVTADTFASPAPAGANVSHAPRQTPGQTVAAAIATRAEGGSQTFEVRLDPAELGRVEIRIEVGADQRVHASIAAEQPAALADLIRASREIERALSDTGLKLAADGLSFDLSRGGAGERQASGREQAGQENFRAAVQKAASLDGDAVAARPLHLSRWSGARIDLKA